MDMVMVMVMVMVKSVVCRGDDLESRARGLAGRRAKRLSFSKCCPVFDDLEHVSRGLVDLMECFDDMR